MSTDLQVHLYQDDTWHITDMSSGEQPFVALQVHGFTTLFVTGSKAADALVAAAMEAKALLDAIGKDKPS